MADSEKNNTYDESLERQLVFSAALDSLTSHIAIVNSDGTILYTNRAWRSFAEENGSYFPTHMTSTDYLDICNFACGEGSDTAKAAAKGICNVINGELNEFSLDYPWHLPDEQRWFNIAATRLPCAGPVRVMIKHDTIADRVLAEIAQANKMETVGRLAAGIAHDFNNLLQGILGYARVLLQTNSLDSAAQEDLREIERASLRATDLIRQILTFSRQAPGKPELVDISALTDEITGLLSRILPRDIILGRSVSSISRPVLADSSKIHQVLMNLCLNARDAMPNGGELMISVDQVELDDAFVREYPWARLGEYIRVVVSDTGCGMDTQIRSKAFEPFFTTKAQQFGSGLGLSTCYGIILAHQGFIHIDSELGQGAKVSVFLPVAAGPIPISSPCEKVEVQTGQETVLLVDDEDYIRLLVKRVLENAGYTVLLASNGREAVNCIESHGDDIDLVVLDLNMPEMNGIQALSVMRQIRPDIRVLVSAGIDMGVGDLSDTQKPNGFIYKPYKPELLLQAVRDVLTGNGEAPFPVD